MQQKYCAQAKELNCHEGRCWVAVADIGYVGAGRRWRTAEFLGGVWRMEERLRECLQVATPLQRE